MLAICRHARVTCRVLPVAALFNHFHLQVTICKIMPLFSAKKHPADPTFLFFRIFEMVRHPWTIPSSIRPIMKNRHELQQQIIEKAMKDENFRKQLIQNPAGALNGAFGFNIPQGFEIEVLEETPKKLYIVLPPNLSENAGDELSEAELNSVAGGSFLDCMTFYTCGGSQCC